MPPSFIWAPSGCLPSPGAFYLDSRSVLFVKFMNVLDLSWYDGLRGEWVMRLRGEMSRAEVVSTILSSCPSV